jgi:hypothetical protein
MHNVNFKKPTIYKIVVQGTIDTNSWDYFSGLQISVNKNKSTTSLIGMISDQSALSGILSKLYDMHMTVISVNMLSETDNS